MSSSALKSVVYIAFVRRIQPHANNDLDYASTECPDPVDALIGSVDIEPIDDIDAVIYLQ